VADLNPPCGKVAGRLESIGQGKAMNMKRALSHIALVGALAMGLVACGGSGVTRPYDDVEATPDSIVGDVEYYSYTLISLGTAYPALFSTEGGH